MIRYFIDNTMMGGSKMEVSRFEYYCWTLVLILPVVGGLAAFIGILIDTFR